MKSSANHLWRDPIGWNRRTSGIFGLLIHDGSQISQTVSFKDLQDVADPVSRYLRSALKEGQRMIRTAHMTQIGEFRVSKRTAKNVPGNIGVCLMPIRRERTERMINNRDNFAKLSID